jgi:hypothetical protein
MSFFVFLWLIEDIKYRTLRVNLMLTLWFDYFDYCVPRCKYRTLRRLWTLIEYVTLILT